MLTNQNNCIPFAEWADLHNLDCTNCYIYTIHVHITCFDSAQVVVVNLEMGRDFIIFLSSFARKILHHMELHSRYSSEVWWKPFQKVYHHPSAIHQLTLLSNTELFMKPKSIRMTVKNCTSLTTDFHPTGRMRAIDLCAVHVLRTLSTRAEHVDYLCLTLRGGWPRVINHVTFLSSLLTLP